MSVSVPPSRSPPARAPPPHPVPSPSAQLTEWLNGKHVVFGQVTDGFDVLKAVEAVGSQSGATSKPVIVEDCGELKEE